MTVDRILKVIMSFLMAIAITLLLVEFFEKNTEYVVVTQQESLCDKVGAFGAAKVTCENYVDMFDPSKEQFNEFLRKEKIKYEGLYESGIYYGGYKEK